MLPRDVIFFSTGQRPQADLAIRLGCTLTNRGTVKTGSLCDTNVRHVFVAGDASRDAQFVVVAAANESRGRAADVSEFLGESQKPGRYRNPDGKRGDARRRTNSSQRCAGCEATPPRDSTNCWTRSLPRL